MEYARLVGVMEYAIPVLLLRYIEIIPGDREKIEIPRTVMCERWGTARHTCRAEPSAMAPNRMRSSLFSFCEKTKLFEQ